MSAHRQPMSHTKNQNLQYSSWKLHKITTDQVVHKYSKQCEEKHIQRSRMYVSIH